MDLVQLMVKLFNLDFKDDDPIGLDSKIKFIMHDVDASRVNINLHLTSFNKAASDQLKCIKFESFVEKVAECEKAFGKRK